MSPQLQVIAVLGVEMEVANTLGNHVAENLIRAGVIACDNELEAALGISVYRPGEDVRDLFSVADRDDPASNCEKFYDACEKLGDIWTLLTYGIDIRVGPWVNGDDAYRIQQFTCPKCEKKLGGKSPSLAAQYSDAIGTFIHEGSTMGVSCPECQSLIDARDWITQPKIGFTHLSLEFWNWPSLQDEAWRLSIPTTVSEITGRDIMMANRHL